MGLGTILDLVDRGWLYNSYEMLTSLCIVTLPFHAAKQVLGHFQSRFIQSMDANAIVHELVHERIIGNHDLTDMTRQQNQMLQACLLRACDEDALMKVCKIVIERGNPAMKSLSEDMKSMLKGKYCVQVFMHAHCMLSVCLTRHWSNMESTALLDIWEDEQTQV